MESDRSLAEDYLAGPQKMVLALELEFSGERALVAGLRDWSTLGVRETKGHESQHCALPTPACSMELEPSSSSLPGANFRTYRGGEGTLAQPLGIRQGSGELSSSLSDCDQSAPLPQAPRPTAFRSFRVLAHRGPGFLTAGFRFCHIYCVSQSPKVC